MCVLLWLTACSPQASSMLYHTARFPLKVEIMYYYMHTLCFLIHSPINRELCCFHIWDMACNTIMNMGLVPWFLFNYPILVILRSEIAGHIILSSSPLSVPPSLFLFLLLLVLPHHLCHLCTTFIPALRVQGFSPQLLIAILTDIKEYFIVAFTCGLLMISNVWV